MDLMELLPPIYDDNDTMKELQNIIGSKINNIAANFNETFNQCFVSTATNLLSRYENIYGINVDVTKSEAFRRERIIAKAKGTGTVTKQMIKDVASSYSNGEVEVIENPLESSFTVKFVGTKGLPPNMADLKVTIEEIKPAHLKYTFEYTYNTWDDVDKTTWNQARAYTWDELRVR